MSARPRARPAATQNLDASALPVGVPSDLPAGADIRSLFFVQARTWIRQKVTEFSFFDFVQEKSQSSKHSFDLGRRGCQAPCSLDEADSPDIGLATPYSTGSEDQNYETCHNASWPTFLSYLAEGYGFILPSQSCKPAMLFGDLVCVVFDKECATEFFLQHACCQGTG